MRAIDEPGDGHPSGALHPLTHRTFPSGVASGDVTDTTVVIWTRIAAPGNSGDRTVTWQVASVGSGPNVTGGTSTAEAQHDHIVQVDVAGLEPATDYDYSFTVDASTIVGRTRTLPRSAERLRFVVACCSRWGWPGFDQYADIVDEQPAFVLHLGDSIYEIGEVPPSGRPTDPPWACHTLDDYRRRHRQHRADPALQRLHANLPVIAIWDDHEVVDNSPDEESGERRGAGQRAWREFMPMPATS